MKKLAHRFSILASLLVACVLVSRADTTLVPAGAAWKYLDTGVNLGTTWTPINFDDSAWTSGTAELGYGDGDEVTTTGFGGNANAKYTTYYFRRAFNVTGADSFGALTLTLTYDDGAVVYVNGTEVWRVNMPAGIITSATFASGAADYTPAVTTIPASVLVEGNNVIAVEVHQSDLTSSDVSFNFSMTANLAPTVAITSPADGAAFSGPTNITLTATANDADGSIARVDYFSGATLIGGATNAPFTFVWSNVTENPYILTAVATDNSSGVSTSAPVNITVVDLNPPTLIGALGTTGNVTVTFSKAVNPATALVAGNYALNNGATISAAAYGSSSNVIVLQTSPLSEGVNYLLTVNNVRDNGGNIIAANSQVGFVLSSFVPQDIGNPAIGGTLTQVPGGFDITAAGTNIFGTADQFSFAYKQISGDFNIKVRLQSFSADSPWAKAGLMARETLAANSRFAATLAGPNLAGVSFHSRSTVPGTNVFGGSHPVNYPYTWLRLQRAGNILTGYASLDGDNWVLLSSVTIAMPSTIYVGYAVSGASASQTVNVAVRDYQDVVGGTVISPTFTREPLGPSTRRTGLVISEIMYHPKERADGKVLEFIELYNSQSIFEDISGYRIGGDINYTFPEGTIFQPGQFIVLAKVKADVESVYGLSGVYQYGVTNGFQTNVVGNVTNVTPNIENSLANSGGTVRLYTKPGALMLEVSFDTRAPWPIEADGTGHSLVLARPSYGEDSPLAWAGSDRMGGSPGGIDPITPEPARNVMINEILANTEPPQEDMIELYNHANTSVNLSGLWLTDDLTTNKFRIPDGTVLGPRAFISFNQSQLGFALSASGEQVLLVNSNQTRVVATAEFGGQQTGVSIGRYPDGAPTLRRLATVTAGAANSAPRVSPVVINEIMYNPITGSNDDEFVELYNRSTNSLDLSNWKFTSGISMSIPPNTLLAPGGYLVVAKNAERLRTNYSNLNSGNLLGDYSGTLANSGETLALSAPEYQLVTNGLGQVSTNIAFHYVVNEVTYGTGGRWGNWSDGEGSSLELMDANSDNSLASNWTDSDDTSKSSWTSFEFTGTLDNVNAAQGANDNLHVYLLGRGECLVDDVEVRSSTGANVMANSTFESGLGSWTMQGAYDQSFLDNTGFTGNRSLHVLGMSRGDTGANKIRGQFVSNIVNNAAYMLRAKARWLRGFPELLLRTHGGGLEAFGRLPVPANLGTPGLVNSRAVTNVGPAIYDVVHAPILPAANQPVVVTARAHDANGLSQLVVRYRIEPSTTFSSVTMNDNGNTGDSVAGDGLYAATIPAQASGARAAFYIQGVDAAGVTNVFPANALNRAFPNDAPSHEAIIRWGEVQMPGTFASYHLWISDAVNARWLARAQLNNAPLDGTFVYNNYRVVYNALPQYGGSPWHIGSMTGPMGGNRVDSVLNFSPDNRVLGETDFILNTVGNPSGNTSSDTSGMVEQTSYEIMKGLGLVYNYRRYIHVFINGDQRSVTGNRPGNFIMEDSQQPNGRMLSQWFPDNGEGQLYKIEDWFEFNDAGTAQSNTDAQLVRRTTTYNGVTTLKLAPYRYMWRKRSVNASESANDYTNLLAIVDIISPAATPTVSPLPDTIVKQFLQVVDVEQWMRISAVQHAIGNWDTYMMRRGKNCYTYRPNFGKFQLMTWDIDFTMGVGGDGTGQSLFDQNDQRVAAMYATPELVRMYWRAYKDLVEGSFTPEYVFPRCDARAAAFAANNVNYDPATVNTVKSYLTGRRSYIQTQLNTVNAAFGVNATNFTSSSNIVTITGTAPIDVKFIEINGVNYPITWTSTTAWSIRLPMAAVGSNFFTLRAFDRLTNAIAGTDRNLAVNFTGNLESPINNVVFNEVMFNPLVPGSEFVEIHNRSTNSTFDLTGWRVNGLGYTFPEGSIMAPRSFLVLTKDRVAFANAYGGSVVAFDQFPGEIQTDGETITLIIPGTTPEQDVVVDRVRFEGVRPWPAAANATGSSIQLIDAAQENARVGNWFANYIPAVYSQSQSTPSRTNDGWRFVSVSGSAGPGIGGGQMRLVMYLGTELGSAIVDDISVVAGTNAAVGQNFVRNGDFESGPLLEVPALTNSWVVGTNYTNTAIIGSLAHGGSGALRIEASAFANAFPRLIAQNLSPAPAVNTTNTLSFWYWATNSSTNLSVRLFNSSALNVTTNINVFIIPSNYIAPTLIAPATNTLSPGAANQQIAALPAFQPLWINEVQADNLTGILDNNGQREPWIEIYNTSSNTVSLEGLYLSSSYENLTNWAFPSGATIAPNQFLVVFCDGQPGQTAGNQYHTSFRLPSSSGSVALSRLYNNQPQVLDYLNYNGIRGDRSYGSFPDGQPFSRLEFFYVTPGAPNDGRSAPLNVVINEWMASNTNFVADPADLDNDDWFEIYNPGSETVDLAGYYLTDTALDKFKYLVTTNGAHLIPPGGYLLVWADNETSQNMSGGVPRTDLHVNFQLAGTGEAIGIYAADGTEIDLVSFGPQTGNLSEGRYPNGAASIYTFTNPTPRAANYLPGVGNNAPSLAAIGSKSLYVNQTLAFTASATDVDPGQTLSFSLDPGAPAEASIGANNGAFTWTPTSVGTNVIVVRVTDNGVPALSDFENVTVRVLALPNFAVPSRNGNELSLSWGTTPGRTYRVEYKNALTDAVWTPLGQNLTAVTDTLSITDNVAGTPQRFYRLVILP